MRKFLFFGVYALLMWGVVSFRLPTERVERTLVREFKTAKELRVFVLEMAPKGWRVVQVTAFANGLPNREEFLLVMER